MLGREILYNAVCAYLSDEEVEQLRNDLVVCSRTVSDKKFINMVNRHFDIERFNTEAKNKNDYLLYNYLMYEYKKGKIISSRGIVYQYWKRVSKNL